MSDGPTSTRPRIIIDLTAEPNRPTEGYRFVRHDARPTPEILQAVWWIAGRFIEVIGEAADSLVRLEFNFSQGPIPGDLRLYCTAELTLDDGASIVTPYNYSHIATDHMRTVERLEEFLIEPWRNDLAKAITDAAAKQQAVAVTTEKLLEHVGKPTYGDIY